MIIGRVKEVSTQGVGWASEEASDLVAPPLNLVLYMHLRIFAYTSNVLIASFEYMELILDSGTPKNFMLLRKSCLSTDRSPVMKLTWSTFQLLCSRIQKVPVLLPVGGRTGIREGVNHFTGSCRIPYRLLCQIEELDILEV